MLTHPFGFFSRAAMEMVFAVPAELGGAGIADLGSNQGSRTLKMCYGNPPIKTAA